MSLWKTRKANKKEGEWDIAGKLSDIARSGHDIIAEAWRNTSEHRQFGPDGDIEPDENERLQVNRKAR
ncbi:hypothetical protein Pmani_029566 [Petrolisthes manimaculis]|uniref:Uncharacterized protein n=1 Tax=Petrolisthes manimaculis TaxID=1843537 RepID=A0AAE1TKU2_9EUCA|nr:hypothetical protein Pmani_037793 [Petrolisthes manimaculis]KAK4298068.1 hypothetical protein Pmani_029566 [Petrolisthes manimaculis]